MAEEGEVQGLAFVIKLGPHDHQAGLAGDYRSSPEEAMSATFLMERKLMKDAPFQ